MTLKMSQGFVFVVVVVVCVFFKTTLYIILIYMLLHVYWAKVFSPPNVNVGPKWLPNFTPRMQ